MKTRKNSAFTLIEVIIVVAIIGLLAAINIPNLYAARARALKNMCFSNLRRIELAKAVFAKQSGKTNSTVIANAEIFGGNYMEEPRCPSGGTYTLGAIGEPPHCSLGADLGHTLSTAPKK